MSEARDHLAMRLHGREYGKELSHAEEIAAKVDRLLVVFGASDDLTEFRGIVYDEGGAYEGRKHIITGVPGQWKLLESRECGPSDKEPNGVAIKAEWCPPALNVSWLITPEVPYAPFDIMEGDGIYCRGAVIDEADLLPAHKMVMIDYTNYRGERATRKILPIEPSFSANEWHPEKQWLWTALDVEKVEVRTFAVKNIHSWLPIA